MNTSPNHSDLRELLSGYIDGELSQQESQQVTQLLERDELARQIYQDLLQLTQRLSTADYPSLNEAELAQLDSIMNDRPASNLQLFGWVATIAGFLILTMPLLYGFIVDDAIALWVKLGATLLDGGGLMLFLSVLRQRLLARKTDKYQKVRL